MTVGGSWFSWFGGAFGSSNAAAPQVSPRPEQPASPAAVTAAGPAAQTTLAEGSRGPEVGALQKQLGLTPDGIYGPKTENAVERYQRAHGLTGDGVVGPRTRQALNAPDVSGKPVLSQGDEGTDVREVQRKVGVSADGIYGSHTENAVERYQRAHGLAADGVVGRATWTSLETPAQTTAHAPVPSAVPALSTPAAHGPLPAAHPTAAAGPAPTPGPVAGTAPAKPAAVAAVPAKVAPVKPATTAAPAAAAGATAEQRWTGWSDATRGAGNNLGDTESALHLFYQQHPALNGEPPADGTPEAKQLSDLGLSGAAKRFATEADPAETGWQHDDDRSIHITGEDKQTAWAMYSQQHPELGGKEPAKGTAAAADLHQFTRYVAQNKYNATIDQALDAHPTQGIDAKDLKSLLVEESNLNPDIGSNRYGYTGIAQLGGDLASKAKANDPLQAIPIAARTLQAKAAYLDRHAFAQYGQPASTEDRANFILGAYNGGEGTIANSIDDAHDDGLAIGKQNGLKGKALTDFANDYATQWQDILAPSTDPKQSPLYQEIPASWGKAEKYHEIGTYGPDIIQRAEQ